MTVPYCQGYINRRSNYGALWCKYGEQQEHKYRQDDLCVKQIS